MYDFAAIRIFFKEEFLFTSFTRGELVSHLDMRECGLRGLKVLPREMTLHIDGNDECHDLYHPWDSLPSSFTGIAFKVYQSSGYLQQPFIEIKASPAKITQGHNVFGSDDLEQGVRAIYQSLKHALPDFSDMLNFDSAEFFRIDATYSIKLPNRDVLASVLDSLSRVSNRYLRPSRDGMYESTIYFNKVRNNVNTGRTTSLCIYSKLDEIKFQLEDLQNKAKKEKTKAYDQVIQALSAPELQHFATDRLRFEARIATRFFDKHGISRNVNKLIAYVKGFESEKGQGAFCHWLWHEAMKDLLDAVSGQEITVIHDSKVKKLLHTAFDTIDSKGKLRTAKAVRLFGFYSRLVHEGHNRVKRTMGRSSFYNSINDLRSIGFSKFELQNLDKEESLPLVHLIKFDFNQQRPASYIEPKLPCSELRFDEFVDMMNGIIPLSNELINPDLFIENALIEMGLTPAYINGLKAGREVRLNESESLSLALFDDGDFNLVVHEPNGIDLEDYKNKLRDTRASFNRAVHKVNNCSKLPTAVGQP